MTDVQRLWLTKAMQRQHREADRKARLEGIRNRVFSKSRGRKG